MTSPIDLASYLTKERFLEDEGLEEEEGEGTANTSEEDWFEQAASDFLAQGASDPVFDAILEATKVFTRKNFALRAGHLYRQQLQNIPSYELVCTLEQGMVELAGEANWLAANTSLAANTHHLGSAEYSEQELVASEWKDRDAAHKSAVIKWALETLMPKLEGTSVIKATRSTKKANNAMLAVPAATLIAMSLEYKALIEQFIKPGTFLPKLAAGTAWKETMQVLSAKSGKKISGSALYNILWSKKEQDQWIYGLLEYANALLAVVTYAQSRDPSLAPRNTFATSRRSQKLHSIEGKMC